MSNGPATKSDLDKLETKVESKLQAMDSKFEAKFESIDKRFEALDAKIDARADETIDLLRTFMGQVAEEFDKVHAEQREMRRQINRILDHLDSIEKRLEITEDEQLVMGHQLKRLQAWTEHLAEKMGIDLTKITIK